MTNLTAAVANHLSVAESLIVEIQEWASVLWIRFASGSPKFVSKKINMANNIEAVSYPKKGIVAYLAKLTIENNRISDRDFYSPTDREKYTGQRSKVWFDLAKYTSVPDGFYELREANPNANSAKREIKSYFEIKDRTIVKEFDSLTEVVESVLGKTPDLPELKGTEKQISWAEDIRKKAIQSNARDLDISQTSAKWWIDNRKNLTIPASVSIF